MRGATPAVAREDWDAVTWAAGQVASSAAAALVARADGGIVAANEAAAALILRGVVRVDLRVLFVDTCLKNRMQTVRVSVPGAADRAMRSFDLTLIPLPERHVFAIGRETTLEINLASALAQSRNMFRELTLRLADFAFETDATGTFSWASAGLLGFEAAELHGVRPHDLFGEAGPFSVRESVSGREVWIKTKSGHDGCLAVTASPVFDQHGDWCGTRGAARDVTALKHLERETLAAKKRDELIRAVVEALRSQIEPRRIMLAAADALAAAADADTVSVRALGSDIGARVGVKNSGLEVAIEVVTSYQGKPNGNVRLTRSAAKGPFDEAARTLIDVVVPHLGVALALVQALEASNAVRCDGPTGLLNRRAFLSEASRKYATAARAGRGFTLFVFDCDESETLSEEAFATAGRTLKSLCGEDDVAGVLDEDEFALASSSRLKLSELGERICADLTEAARRSCPDVSISAGCAAAAAEADETLEDVLARAECALHVAKREGRRCVVSADASLKVTSCSSD